MLLEIYKNSLGLRDDQINSIFDSLDSSEGTKQEYLQRIKYFLDFMQVSQLGYDTYLNFKKHLASKNNYGISTKNKYLYTAKVFLKELYRRGLIPADITTGVKGFQQNKKHKRPGVTDEEVVRLLDKLHQLGDEPSALRLKALFCLLMFQGLRQVEIMRLNVANLDLMRQVAFVQGKGNDDTEPIDLHPETVRMLRDYLKAYKLADGPLFVSLSNRGRNERLTTRSMRRLVDNLHKELEIEKSAHGYRHYFTTKLIRAYKGDLLAVRQRTRHKSLEMLQVYNDNILQKEDLPRYYGAFKGVEVK